MFILACGLLSSLASPRPQRHSRVTVFGSVGGQRAKGGHQRNDEVGVEVVTEYQSLVVFQITFLVLHNEGGAPY